MGKHVYTRYRNCHIRLSLNVSDKNMSAWVNHHICEYFIYIFIRLVSIMAGTVYNALPHFFFFTNAMY